MLELPAEWVNDFDRRQSQGASLDCLPVDSALSGQPDSSAGRTGSEPARDL